METTTLFLKVLRAKHPQLHNIIVDKCEQMNLVAPISGEDSLCHEYNPTRIKNIVQKIHQAAMREQPEHGDLKLEQRRENEISTVQRNTRPPPLLAHTGVISEPTTPLTIQLPTSTNTTADNRDSWRKMPPVNHLQPSSSRDSCKGCGLDHPVEHCPFIFHQLYRDKGDLELFYPAFYKMSDEDTKAYLTHLVTHGFMKTLTQTEVDNIIRILTRKKRGFQRGQDDPDRDNYRRTKHRYGDYPNPPDTRKPYQERGNDRSYQDRVYDSRRFNRSPERARRNVDNRPAWEKKKDQDKN